MFLFYIDESGERDYSSPARYFALCALGIRMRDWKAINTDLLSLKKTYFGNVEVEIKSNWLRNPKERQRRYLSQYPVTEPELEEFTGKVYDVLLSSDVVLIASVVDKEQMKQQYAHPEEPNTLAYELTFERIERFLQQQEEAHGLLIYDKITELAVKKEGYENLLARQHLRFMEKGTDFVRVSRIVEGLLFIPSHENNLLQLADLCAYNVYRQFQQYGPEWDTGKAFQTRYPFFEKIEPKFYRDSQGKYAGWGVKKFP